jgi:hypothetical protein
MGDASSGGPGVGAVDCRRLGLGSCGMILFVHTGCFGYAWETGLSPRLTRVTFVGLHFIHPIIER